MDVLVYQISYTLLSTVKLFLNILFVATKFVLYLVIN